MKSFAFALVMLRKTVVVATAAFALAGSVSAYAAKPSQIQFPLHINPAFRACLAKDNKTVPIAVAKIVRGVLNDTLTLRLVGFKPNLDFDLFTVQRSNLLANATVNPNFTNFGLAWYQSDVHTNSIGAATVGVKTILLDQIFGFDPDKTLNPLNTFQLGFWFNNPADANVAPCHFAGFTPFNGDHHAGPVAFITVPNATTNLGPLCSDPNTSTNPAHCNP